MKKHSKSLLVLVALFVSTISFAQQGPEQGHQRPSREEMKQHMEQLANDLNLTADQKAQFHAIHKEAHQKRRTLKESGASKEEMKKIKVEKNKKLQSLLTAEQFALYKEKKAEHKKNRPNKG